jgi:hypothetical protein
MSASAAANSLRARSTSACVLDCVCRRFSARARFSFASSWRDPRLSQLGLKFSVVDLDQQVAFLHLPALFEVDRADQPAHFRPNTSPSRSA